MRYWGVPCNFCSYKTWMTDTTILAVGYTFFIVFMNIKVRLVLSCLLNCFLWRLSIQPVYVNQLAPDTTSGITGQQNFIYLTYLLLYYSMKLFPLRQDIAWQSDFFLSPILSTPCNPFSYIKNNQEWLKVWKYLISCTIWVISRAILRFVVVLEDALRNY